jgi:hypothetical protein
MKQNIKQVVKTKLSLARIEDLVLVDRRYNHGLFGCIDSRAEQEQKTQVLNEQMIFSYLDQSQNPQESGTIPSIVSLTAN